MRNEFIELADGNEKLLNWFQLGHCTRCTSFTLQPYFLGCHTNHVFCERCVVETLVVNGPQCPKCSNEIKKIDGTTFLPHAGALLNLVKVKMPVEAEVLEKDAQMEKRRAKTTIAGEQFLTRVLHDVQHNHKTKNTEWKIAEKQIISTHPN